MPDGLVQVYLLIQKLLRPQCLKLLLSLRGHDWQLVSSRRSTAENSRNQLESSK